MLLIGAPFFSATDFSPGACSAYGYDGTVRLQALADAEGGFTLLLCASGENAAIGRAAAEALVTRINREGNLQVDGIAGATATSSAVFRAAEEALLEIGLDPKSLTPSLQPARLLTERCDLLVVGGGAAGLCAAIAAADAGLDVLLVEQSEILGGSAARASGLIFAGGSALQQKAGIRDSAIVVTSEIFRTSSGYNHALLGDLSLRCAGNLEFLQELNIRFEPQLQPLDGFSDTPRAAMIAGGGSELICLLIDEARARGVCILTDCRLTEIMQDGTGRVMGGRCILEGRDLLEIECGAMLLATGGSGASELLGDRTSRGIGAISLCVPGSDGSGILLAEELGAAVRTGSASLLLQGWDPKQYAEGWLVTPAGRRFTNEEGSASAIGDALSDAGVSSCWLICDQTLFEQAAKSDLLILAAAWGADAQALGEAMGAPDFAANAARFELLAREGDSDFGKAGRLLRLPGDTGIYALKLGCATYAASGGIAVDREFRVLHRDGYSIDGLYAAGELIGASYFGNHAPEMGLLLAQAVDSGRASGASAAHALNPPAAKELRDTRDS